MIKVVPRNQLTKDEIRHQVLKLKNDLYLRQITNWNMNPKDLAHEYLNRVLDKIDEYGR
jgi:hypothetical protein